MPLFKKKSKKHKDKDKESELAEEGESKDELSVVDKGKEVSQPEPVADIPNLEDYVSRVQEAAAADDNLSEGELSESEEDEDTFIGEDFDFDEDSVKALDWTCLSPEEIVRRKNAEISSLSDLLEISKANAAVLLRYFQWKKETLLAQYFENPNQVMQEAGCELDAERAVEPEPLELSEDEAGCGICGDDGEDEEGLTALKCGHGFCRTCWESYLTLKIEEGTAICLRCPQFKCPVLLDDVTIHGLVSPLVHEKFQRFSTKSFVDDNHWAKWCPSPGCGNAITSDMVTETVVLCTCGFRFCFECHRPAHLPATCDMMKTWEEKCQDDSETNNWMSINTKLCPKCEVVVEKNGGCNHMQCPKCKFDYCWVCMRPWKGHNDFYSCNRFDKERDATKRFKFWSRGKKRRDRERRDEEDREANRLALARYLHYYERFANHNHSITLERNLKKKLLSEQRAEVASTGSLKALEVAPVAAATEEEDESGVVQTTWLDVRFMEKALDELITCRAVLQHTYVVAYYLSDMDDNLQKKIFESLQEDLEVTTERLSELLATPTVPRIEAVNLTNLTRTKRENLLHAVKHGLRDDTVSGV